MRKNSIFENFECALYSTSGSIPFNNFTVSNSVKKREILNLVSTATCRSHVDVTRKKFCYSKIGMTVDKIKIPVLWTLF